MEHIKCEACEGYPTGIKSSIVSSPDFLVVNIDPLAQTSRHCPMIGYD